jgi:hypothetical protein
MVRRAAALALAVVAAACSSGSDDDTASVTGTSSRRERATTTTIAVRYSTKVATEVDVDPAYRQGLARVDDGWVFSLNDGLFRTDDALAQTKVRSPAIPDEWRNRGFNHIGDIDIVDGVLYAPLEQPDYERGEQAMLTYDAATLEYTDGLTVAQHENSFVTVDAEMHVAYTLDRFGGSELLRYDVDDDWRLLEPLVMSKRIERVQGADIADGAVWLSADDDTDGLYRVDLETGEVQSLGSIGHVDGEAEGIDATPTDRADLHVLSIDAKQTPVRLIEFDVVKTARR